MFTEFSDTTQKTFTVSELNRKVKSLLELHLPLIWVEGEISNFSQPASGHWYFTLKDERAQVRCAMFKGRNGRLRFTPKNGDHIKMRASVGIYEGRGDYQLIAEHMEEAGTGLLQRRFEELKQKLFDQGLFDEGFKKPLPDAPKHIAIITSPSGAAIQDMLSVLARRFPSLHISIIPSAVQGEEAPKGLIDGLEFANRIGKFDLVVLCRGGGSIEDLWAFNNEQLAKAIFASELPVVSAVGHEIDFTIADFVADLRAPTPSAAAELICPDQEEIRQRVILLKQRLNQTIQNRIKHDHQLLSAAKGKIKHPLDRIYFQMQKLDQLADSLFQNHQRHITARQTKLLNLENRLNHSEPSKKVQQLKTHLSQLNSRLNKEMQSIIELKALRLNHLAHGLDTVSPLATMARGYSITTNQEQEVVQSVQHVKVGDQVEIRVNDGKLAAQINGVTPEK